MHFQPIIGMSLEIGDMLYYLVLFAILMLLVAKFAWGPVMDMMEKRRQKISDDLDNAEKSRTEAAQMAQEREEALKNSKADAVEIIATAKTNGETQKNLILADANTAAKDIKQKADLAAEKAKQDALASAQTQVADLSVAIAEKLIQKELTTADQTNLIDSFIKGLDPNETK